MVKPVFYVCTGKTKEFVRRDVRTKLKTTLFRYPEFMFPN